MGKVYERIDGRLRAFIEEQPLFFTGTAPSGSGGHVNISPKGLAGTFAILDERTVAYLDYTGSGVETIAHLRDNGRIVLMFCAFTGPPNIVRLHGTGEPVPPDDPRFGALVASFGDPERLGLRAVIVVDVQRISDSCGYGVPLMEFRDDRPTLRQWAESRGPEKLVAYRAEKNATSLDGLPGLPMPGG
jgi:hypothetical protein